MADYYDAAMMQPQVESSGYVPTQQGYDQQLQHDESGQSPPPMGQIQGMSKVDIPATPSTFHHGSAMYYPNDSDDYSTIATEPQIVDSYPPPQDGGHEYYGNSAANDWTAGTGQAPIDDHPQMMTPNSSTNLSSRNTAKGRRKFNPSFAAVEEEALETSETATEGGGHVYMQSTEISTIRSLGTNEASFLEKVREFFIQSCACESTTFDNRRVTKLKKSKSPNPPINAPEYNRPQNHQQMQTYGRQVDLEGNVYEGNFCQGKREGHGSILYIRTKDRYEGEWFNDMPHGMGKLVRGDGFGEFEGRWVNGDLQEVKEGFAHVMDDDGTTYAGTFLAWKKHGTGTMIVENGVKYRGEWADGLKHGYGVLMYPDGTTFEGMFENDEPVTQAESEENENDHGELADISSPLSEANNGKKLWKKVKLRSDKVLTERKAQEVRNKKLSAENQKKADLEKNMLKKVKGERRKLEKIKEEQHRILNQRAKELEDAQRSLAEQQKQAERQRREMKKQQRAFNAKTRSVQNGRSRRSKRSSHGGRSRSSNHSSMSSYVGSTLSSKMGSYRQSWGRQHHNADVYDYAQLQTPVHGYASTPGSRSMGFRTPVHGPASTPGSRGMGFRTPVHGHASTPASRARGYSR